MDKKEKTVRYNVHGCREIYQNLVIVGRYYSWLQYLLGQDSWLVGFVNCAVLGEDIDDHLLVRELFVLVWLLTAHVMLMYKMMPNAHV